MIELPADMLLHVTTPTFSICVFPAPTGIKGFVVPIPTCPPSDWETPPVPD